MQRDSIFFIRLSSNFFMKKHLGIHTLKNHVMKMDSLSYLFLIINKNYYFQNQINKKSDIRIPNTKKGHPKQYAEYATRSLTIYDHQHNLYHWHILYK